MKRGFSKLSIKIIVSFALIVVLMTFIFGSFMYIQFSRIYEDYFRQKLITSAKAAALSINVENHEKLLTVEDMNTDTYEYENEMLQKVLGEIGVKYIYTLRKVEDKFVFVLDAAEKDQAEIGYECEATQAMEKALSGEASADEEFTTDEWGTYLSAYAPIKDKQGHVVAIAGVDVDASDVIGTRSRIVLQYSTLLFVYVLIVVIVSFIIAGRITKPINAVTEKMIETSGKAGDMTQRLKVQTNDEIGELSHAFNKLFDTLHDILKKVKLTTGILSESSQQLSAATESSIDSINQIAGKSSELSEGIDEAGELFKDMKHEIEVFSINSKDIRAKTDELNRFAQHLNGSAQNVSSAVKDSSDSMDTLSKLTIASNADILELGTYSESIGSIVETISGITQQTNLLALNAMIEARRAGEAGNGFIVVAENIRALSDSTRDSAEQIRELINQLVSKINKIVQLQKSIEPILERTLTDFTTADRSLKDIFEKFEIIVDKIASISSANENQVYGISRLLTLADTIYNHFNKQIELAQVTAAATQELNSTSEEIMAKSNDLSNVARELEDIIKNFKL